MEKYWISLLENAKELDIELTNNQLKQFQDYMKLLLEWNQKINLTAITESEEIIQKHFIDSLTILKYIKENDKVIDIGTGAGFPGIPIKIVKPEIEINLADSLNKRINFLNIVIEKLNLMQVNTIHTRIEDLGRNKDYREKLDVVTSRAVASFNVLLEYMLPLLKIGGICICMKGSNIEEIENSKKALETLGGEIEKVEELMLPGSDIKRNIIIVKKIRKTPMGYPRKPGIPRKLPLE